MPSLRTKPAALCGALLTAWLALGTPAALAGGADPEAVSEVQITDVKRGSGEAATRGSLVTVHYTGWLHDPDAKDHKGKQFDSSRGDTPFQFTVGAGQVIAGWDEGLLGMKVGGKRTLVIPPEMGYGERGAGGSIPPNATLIFDVELLQVR